MLNLIEVDPYTKVFTNSGAGNFGIRKARLLPADFPRSDRDLRPVSNTPVVRNHKAARLGIPLHLINLYSRSAAQHTTHSHRFDLQGHMNRGTLEVCGGRG